MTAGTTPAPNAPGPGTLAEPQVQAMFDRIAGIYDRLNSVMTAGLHHRWRERAADLAEVGAGDRVLDVATGTGDLAIALKRRVGADGEVVGSDFSERMLELARAKAADIEFEQGNALDLPYADASFDAVTVGFGARNFSDLSRGLAEMVRVVRPGGRVGIFERDPDSYIISHPDRALTRRIVAAQSDHGSADSWLARSLPRLHAEAGLQGLRVRAFTSVETDPTGFYSTRAERYADAALQAGVITEPERARWLEALRAALTWQST
jgi:demethylmenaquinone methyltransferase/2-methoxy-6-polyprenyl-1,4-benzoquinol methylase